MATFYVKSGSGVTEFAQSNAYTTGQRMVPKRADTAGNYAVARNAVWECTTGGTSAAAEPTWPGTIVYDTTTVTSGGATFTARKPGFSSGTTADWTFATIYLDYPSSTKVLAGDTVYISNNHAENDTTAFLLNNGQGQIHYLCVNDSAAPPTALATTATITTTGAFALTVSSINGYFYGLTFICGATDTGTRNLTATGIFENCSFQMGTTGGSSILAPTGLWKNCTVKFAAAGQQIAPGGPFKWKSGSILSGGTSPTSLFGEKPGVYVENVDFSNANAAMNLVSGGSNAASVVFKLCKLPASFSGALAASAPVQFSSAELTSVDNTGSILSMRRKMSGGEAFNESTIIRTGGANNAAAGFSHKLVASSIARFPACMVRGTEVVKWVGTAGSQVTATVEFVHDSLTALKDNEIWMELAYYSASGSPLGAIISSAPNVMATASDTTASTETWTTTGLTNPNTRKLSVTFTPLLVGYAHVNVYLAKPSTTVYVDPKVALSFF